MRKPEFEIYNVGKIFGIGFELKRINVFMGRSDGERDFIMEVTQKCLEYDNEEDNSVLEFDADDTFEIVYRGYSEFAIKRAGVTVNLSNNNPNRKKRNYRVINIVEQNLHPKEQVEYIQKLVKELDSDPEAIIVLSTNSPYILYTLNNYVMAAIGKDNPYIEDLKIQPSDVNFFEIENGELRDIKTEDGTLSKNGFDDVMKEVMNDFYKHLNYI